MPKKIEKIDDAILELLTQRESISVKELSSMYSYSIPVLRKICKDIAVKYSFFYKRGVLNASSDNIYENTPFMTEKKIIAQKAASFIKDGDTIFIGAGTTTLQICRYLHHKKTLTIITNSIPVLTTLLKYPHITSICVGGVLQHQDQALVGEFADIFIKNFHVDKLFLGTEGIDIKKGASRSVIQKNMAEHIVTNLDGKIFLLADSSKFGKITTWLWLPIQKIQTIITDARIPIEYKKELNNSHINLEIV